MTRSSLASTADRSSTQLRPSSSHDNWGGDETVSLTVLTTSLPHRVEWSEGKGAVWDIWCWDADADIQEGDIILVEDDDITLALDVMRVTPTSTLKTKQFHHWEVTTEESELSVAALKTQAGI